MAEENAAAGVRQKMEVQDMTPPRSLSRCRSCRSAAAGVTCTEKSEGIWHDKQGRKRMRRCRFP